MAAGAGGGGASALAKLTTPAKVAIGVVIPGLIALGYMIVFYGEVTAKIEQAQRQQAALKSELANQQQAQASYFADRDELALRQQRQREFNKVLPAETEVATFLSAGVATCVPTGSGGISITSGRLVSALASAGRTMTAANKPLRMISSSPVPRLPSRDPLRCEPHRSGCGRTR